MKNVIIIASLLSLVHGALHAQVTRSTTVSVSTVLKSSLDLSTVNGEMVPSCNNGNFGSPTPVRVNMRFACFPTNLRMVENPLAFGSGIRMTMRMSPEAGSQVVQFDIPFNIVLPEYNGSPPGNPEQPTNVSVANGSISELRRDRNVISFKLDNVRLRPLIGGEIDRVAAPMSIEKIEAEQFTPPTLPPGYPHTGHNGLLTTEVSKDFSGDQCVYNINIRIPGGARPGQGPWYLTRETNGFCDGFYSPLMVFEDKKRPRFTGTTDFQLMDYPTKTFWVEPGAPGHFVAIDKNKNGLIDDGTELFGDRGGFSNGFQSIAQFDLNGDWKIDSKDAIWSELLLWQDKNGDGKSSKDEIQTAKEFGLVSLNLRYKSKVQNFGERANYRQASTFKFKRGGKVMTGDLLDIWFADYESSRLAQRESRRGKKVLDSPSEKLGN